ncbi:MAG: MarR family transcriptional regulator [Cyclobacteriaceae bacterium]|nr:MarR family transcriptional regulator [Cyclobacteriaceae bacterium]
MKKIRQSVQRRFNLLGFNITVDQWVILYYIFLHDGISQNELAIKTHKDAPTVTRIIDLLCKKGLVKRQMDGKDRRRFRIFMTDEGKKKVDIVLPEILKMRAQGLKGLQDGDLIQLMRILESIFKNYED